VSSPKDTSTVDESPSRTFKKPALFLDNISSPPDSGSNSGSAKNAFGGGSDTSKNKSSLSYMLNRDPLKEFFHLTLQSVKMNSPHMNQILNMNGDMFYKKAIDDSVPFNQWGTWIEDQLNRIVLSKILKMNMINKMKTAPKIEDKKIEDKVEKMDSLQVAKMIKKMPITAKAGGGKKGLFSFGFMKKKSKMETITEEEPKAKPKSEFDEIFQQAKVIPKTSRNAGKKSFSFFNEAAEDAQK
jgi:hypothetical protein